MRAWLRAATVLVLAACVQLAQAASPPTGEPLRAMTYNIRLDLASDGPNAWAGRKTMVAGMIRYEAPDVIGLQEVLLHQKRDLQAALPAYAFVGVGRDDGAEGGEFSPVGWRRDRFELIETATFWLSPTPWKPGKAWDAAYPRIATWAVLRDRRSGRHIRIINTHFDHVGVEARTRSAALIAEWTARHVAKGQPVIAMGDFNTSADTPPMVLLAEPARSGLQLARSISAEPPFGPAGTFNAFCIDADEALAIDHVLVSPAFAVQRYAVLTQHWNGRLPSDHYPVVVDLIFRPIAGDVPASRR